MIDLMSIESKKKNGNTVWFKRKLHIFLDERVADNVGDGVEEDGALCDYILLQIRLIDIKLNIMIIPRSILMPVGKKDYYRKPRVCCRQISTTGKCPFTRMHYPSLNFENRKEEKLFNVKNNFMITKDWVTGIESV